MPMFTIRDGREHFYQWDLDRQLVIADPSMAEVHFCNRTDECSLVVKVKEEDGLRVADVPNIILQSNFDIRVFGYDGKATLHDKKFKISARTRPADYVYTETEVYAIEDVVDKMLNDKKPEFIKELEATTIGDIEAALDEIIALQNEVMGGDEV